MERRVAASWGLRLGIPALAFLAVPWASVQALPVPWAFIFLAWAAICWWLAFRRGVAPALWFNVGILCLALAGAEAWLALGGEDDAAYRAGHGPEPLTRGDDDLGYRPAPGVRRRVVKQRGGEVVYDVTVTIGEDGLRVAPPTRDAGAPRCLLCFGGSYTFGEGLEDEETWPWRVGVRTGGRFAVRNFACSGYGPHQMLAQVEDGFVRSHVEGAPEHAIYVLLPGHAQRAAGGAVWDMRGPRYALEDDGRLVRRGQFGDGLGSVRRRLRKWLSHSEIWMRAVGRRRPPTAAEAALLAAIVERARDSLRDAWPALAFHVILWDAGPADPDAALVASALEARGFQVPRVSGILPGDGGPFHIPGDGHPNARAADALAAWIVRELLGGPGGADDR